MTMAVLTTLLVADMKSCKSSWGSGPARVGGLVKYFFKSSKASCASCVRLNLSYFLRSLKNGSPLMPSGEMNLLKAAIHPTKFWTSWRLLGGSILVIADTFFGLGSIPRRETIYPSNFLEVTPDVHFSGFSFILNFLRLSKVSARSEMSPSSYHVLTMMSSIYASTLHPSCEYRHCCIPL
jgi:hypothetical protein